MENIIWKIKPFKELSLNELYKILQLRSIVFVVEQNCVYLDIDDKDQKAIHVFAEINGKIVAYSRLFNKGDYFEQASIGRVISHPDFRKIRLGHELMQKSIDYIKDNFNQTQITISAQEYLKNFYESHGFVQTSESYLEDDIPHIEMKKP